jgi:hypothetical protein
VSRENAVEEIELGLVLYQAGSGQVVKVIHALRREPVVHRIEQGQQFGYGRLQPAPPKHEKEPG